MNQNFEAYSLAREDLNTEPASGVDVPRHNLDDDTDTGDWIAVGDLALSSGLRKATHLGKDLGLTAAEFNILEYLLRSRGKVVSREDLVQAALGRHLGTLDRSIDVHISRLRKKLVKSGAGETHIKAIRGVGYIYTAFPTNLQS
jgi:DNA-binding response OmpR family regulator